MKHITNYIHILIGLTILSAVFTSCPPPDTSYTVQNETLNDLKVSHTKIFRHGMYNSDSIRYDTVIENYILESGVNHIIFNEGWSGFFFDEQGIDTIRYNILDIYTDSKVFNKDVYDRELWISNNNSKHPDMLLIVNDEDME